jgi:hypothetical protein
MPIVPISLSDDQLTVILNHAEPLPPSDRHRFLVRVAELLSDKMIGDGSVYAAARQAQAEIFRAPNLTGNSGVARHDGNSGVPNHKSKLQRRASAAT